MNTASTAMVLYLDVFFLVNFLMDLFLLDLTKHFLRLPCRKWRLALAAAGGAVFACFFTVLRFPYVYGILPALEGVGAAGAMVWAAFGRTGKKEFFQRVTVFFLAGCLLGGILAALPVRGNGSFYIKNSAGYLQWRLLPLVLWGFCAYLGIELLGAALAIYKKRGMPLCQVTLEYHGRKKTVTALRDTGNQLFEPYCHQPVHVITERIGRDLCEKVDGVIYIPFQSIGTGYGLLPGIRIDAMTVMQEGGEARRYERPWVAVSTQPLSQGDQYEMLLHGNEP